MCALKKLENFLLSSNGDQSFRDPGKTFNSDDSGGILLLEGGRRRAVEIFDVKPPFKTGENIL